MDIEKKYELCKVKQAGPGEFGNMNILLKNKSEEKWYKVDPSIAQNALLVALDAITHKKEIGVIYSGDIIFGIGNITKNENVLIGYAIPTGFFGTDHTYVKSENPTFTWPCWGRSEGGKEICRGSGDVAFANCLSQPFSSAGIIYAITGVCHQTANRILFPTGLSRIPFCPITVSKAGGYWLSTLVYGVYGRPESMPEWYARLAICMGIKILDLLKQTTSSEDPERAYLQKVISLYSKLDTKPTENESINLSGEELKLMMGFRLSKELDTKVANQILKYQKDFLENKNKRDRELQNTDLRIKHYVQESNDKFGELLRQVADVIGKEQFEKIFDLAPPKDNFPLIDPDIAVNVLSNK